MVIGCEAAKGGNTNSSGYRPTIDQYAASKVKADEDKPIVYYHKYGAIDTGKCYIDECEEDIVYSVIITLPIVGACLFCCFIYTACQLKKKRSDSIEMDTLSPNSSHMDHSGRRIIEQKLDDFGIEQDQLETEETKVQQPSND